MSWDEIVLFAWAGTGGSVVLQVTYYFNNDVDDDDHTFLMVNWTSAIFCSKHKLFITSVSVHGLLIDEPK